MSWGGVLSKEKYFTAILIEMILSTLARNGAMEICAPLFHYSQIFQEGGIHITENIGIDCQATAAVVSVKEGF